MDRATDGARVDLATDGARVDLATDGARTERGTEGARADAVELGGREATRSGAAEAPRDEARVFRVGGSSTASPFGLPLFLFFDGGGMPFVGETGSLSFVRFFEAGVVGTGISTDIVRLRRLGDIAVRSVNDKPW